MLEMFFHLKSQAWIRWHNLTFFSVIRKQKKGKQKSRCLLAHSFLWRQKGPLSPLEERWDILHHHGVKLFRPIEKDEKHEACTGAVTAEERRPSRPNNSSSSGAERLILAKNCHFFNVSRAIHSFQKKRAYLAAFISLWGFFCIFILLSLKYKKNCEQLSEQIILKHILGYGVTKYDVWYLNEEQTKRK